MNKVLLLILDGWGEGKENFSNPIHLAKKATFDYLRDHFPFFLLQASGVSVGLPWNEVGNSEVGHLTLGAGKVYYQNYPRITLAIRNKSFFENPVLKDHQPSRHPGPARRKANKTTIVNPNAALRKKDLAGTGSVVNFKLLLNLVRL